MRCTINNHIKQQLEIFDKKCSLFIRNGGFVIFYDTGAGEQPPAYQIEEKEVVKWIKQALGDAYIKGAESQKAKIDGTEMQKTAYLMQQFADIKGKNLWEWFKKEGMDNFIKWQESKAQEYIKKLKKE